MRIAIVTDAWAPQVNGVVNTLKATRQCLANGGHEVHILGPGDLNTFACPTYPEIRLARKPYAKVESTLDAFAPHCIHIATEGPMGLAARRYCLNRGLDFTTSYHTRFPEYARSRSIIPLAFTYCWLRWFHGPSKAVMVPTAGMKQVLEERGFRNVVLWGRGVDTNYFKPERRDYSCIARPLDTFGLVMAEAMACGVPVAAYPVEGPLDVVVHGRSGMLDHDLAKACTDARRLRRARVRRHALKFSWGAATQQFLRNLLPVRKCEIGDRALVVGIVR